MIDLFILNDIINYNPNTLMIDESFFEEKTLAIIKDYLLVDKPNEKVKIVVNNIKNIKYNAQIPSLSFKATTSNECDGCFLNLRKQPVSIKFKYNSNYLKLKHKLPTVASWNLSKMFPLLYGSEIIELPYQNPRIVFSTSPINSETLSQNIHLQFQYDSIDINRANTKSQRTFKKLTDFLYNLIDVPLPKLIFDPMSNHMIPKLIEKNSSYNFLLPNIDFKAHMHFDDYTSGFFIKDFLKVSQLYLGGKTTYYTPQGRSYDDGYISTQMYLGAKVSAVHDTSDQPVELDMNAQLSSSFDIIRFSAQPSDHRELLQPHQVLPLLGLQDVSTHWDKAMRLFGQYFTKFKFNFFSADFSLAMNPTVFNTQISIQTPEVIYLTRLFNQDILLKDCQLNLLAIDPFNKFSPNFIHISNTFSGALNYKDHIFNVTFNCNSTDNLSLLGTLHPKRITNIYQISQRLFDDQTLSHKLFRDFPSIQVQDLSLSLDLMKKNDDLLSVKKCSVHGQTVGFKLFDHDDFNLQEGYVSLNHDPETNSSIFAKIDGVFYTPEISLNLSGLINSDLSQSSILETQDFYGTASQLVKWLLKINHPHYEFSFSDSWTFLNTLSFEHSTLRINVTDRIIDINHDMNHQLVSNIGVINHLSFLYQHRDPITQDCHLIMKINGLLFNHTQQADYSWDLLYEKLPEIYRFFEL